MSSIYRNLPENYSLQISPKEFEILVRDFLAGSGAGLQGFEVLHDVHEVGDDGNSYQIDVKASFEIFSGSIVIVLVECKLYKNPVKKERVEILRSRLQSLGAHKGMIFSTSGFQKGAVKFADRHKISLVRMIEGKFTYMAKDQFKANITLPPDLPKFVGIYEVCEKEEWDTTYQLSQDGYLDPIKKFIESPTT